MLLGLEAFKYKNISCAFQLRKLQYAKNFKKLVQNYKKMAVYTELFPNYGYHYLW